jgi:preprotein translocase subunit YajC
VERPSDVATVTPVVTTNTAHVAVNAATVVINGFGFDAVAANNTVVLNNGAVGTVTAASATSITVTFSFSPASGSLTAIVTSNGISSGSAVQVANSRPVVTSSIVNLSANATTVTINGFGFNPTAAQNLVAFNNNAIGTVTTATKTSLVVTFSIKPKTAGSLTAIVVTNGIASGTAVQVATVVPVVTSSTSGLAATATTLTINGLGFDPIANRNLVTFNNGAVGTVTAATTSSLTVTLSTKPTTAGSLTAVVTTNSISSGTAAQVATVTPVVTTASGNLLANAATLTITGFGFDPTPANNTVVLNSGAVGTVTAATATSLTVTLSTKPIASSNLTAVVTTNSLSSGAAVKIANAVPVVTSSTTGLAITGTTLTINGFGFDPVANRNTVVLSNGAVGTVTTATATTLTVTLSTRPNILGSITAIVTTNTIASGNAVQVANVIPVVTSSTAGLSINAATIVIAGAGFSATANLNTVVFNNGAVGTVAAATATSLTVTLTTKPTAVGNLTAIVTVSSVASGTAVQVATVQPVVTTGNANVVANASTITINGFGFDTTAANNTVTLSNGAVGTVTTATATVLTVSLSTKPTSVGNFTAVVTTNGVTSGAAIQIATIIPVVTSSTGSLAANSNTVTINGFAFDPVASRNLVVFSNGAVGTVTSATQRTLTVTLSTRPTAAGSLTAVVTTNSLASGNPVQIANVVPVITSSTANLGANSATMTISGFGFSTTAASNTVAFNNGVVGTVTAATANLLTLTLSTRPSSVGNLTAIVTTNSLSSGSAVQVARVVPTVTSSTTALAAGTTTLTIAGFGFDSTITNNSLSFNNGAVGIITAATSTSLSITFAALPNIAGPLNAVVTTSLFSSAATAVATVSPVVTPTINSISASATTLTITGSNFDPTAANNTVVLDKGAIGTVTSATRTSLTVTLTTKPTTAGNLTAIVTTNGISSGPAIQVATVTPVVTNSTTSLAINSTTVTIRGFGFDPVAANNTVVMNNGAVGTVTAATATSLTVTFTTKPTAIGSLTAVVTTNSQSSGAPTQIASVAPAVTAVTTSIAANASTVTITGAGFSTVAANNTVTFNNGAVGTVTAATATTLTVTFSTKPQTAGSLTAIVVTNGASSGAAVQVANVTPVVTLSTANLAITASTITITGFGFSAIAAGNSVVFNNGAVGTITASTATTLTITFTTKPTRTGVLTAIITSNLLASGLAVQVANVI